MDISNTENYITSENYADYIIVDIDPLPRFFESVDPSSIHRTNLTLRLSLINARPIPNNISINEIPYLSIPSLYSPMNYEILDKSGISRITSISTLNLTGAGVYIAIIDTGINIFDEAFITPEGKTKIYRLWDQTDNSGTPPEQIFYGTEYTEDMINEMLTEYKANLTSNNLTSNNTNTQSSFSTTTLPTAPPGIDYQNHGNQLAKIAVGNDNPSSNFKGVAPDAKLIIVKLKPAKKYLREYYGIRDDAIVYEESDILFGLAYVRRTALYANIPVSIIIGLGTSKGDHNGHDYLSQTIDNTTPATGVAVCVPAGNEGDKRLHFNGNTSLCELKVGANVPALYAEIWIKPPFIFYVSITSPSGEQIDSSDFRLNRSETFSFIFDKTLVLVESKPLEPSSEEELILLRFTKPSEGVWRIEVKPSITNIDIRNIFNGSTLYNIWLPQNNAIYRDTFFLSSDPYTTITSPGDSKNAITVSAININTNGIFSENSKGFLPNGNIKPELCAYSNFSSSGAAALCGGCAALLLQWGIIDGNYKDMTGTDIKNFLIYGAFRPSTNIFPDRDLGYGYLNLYNSFELIIRNSL